MKNKFLFLTFLLIFAGCSSTPVGHVVNETGNNTFHVRYAGKELRVGDKVRIVKMETDYTGESSPPSRKKVIGEGRVSTILNGNYYEITTETAQHIPSDALIEKF